MGTRLNLLFRRYGGETNLEEVIIGLRLQREHL